MALITPFRSPLLHDINISTVPSHSQQHNIDKMHCDFTCSLAMSPISHKQLSVGEVAAVGLSSEIIIHSLILSMFYFSEKWSKTEMGFIDPDGADLAPFNRLSLISRRIEYTNRRQLTQNGPIQNTGHKNTQLGSISQSHIGMLFICTAQHHRYNHIFIMLSMCIVNKKKRCEFCNEVQLAYSVPRQPTQPYAWPEGYTAALYRT